MSKDKCGTCPACTGLLQGNNECDRVLEVSLLQSLASLFDVLSDPSVKPLKLVTGPAKKTTRGATRCT